ncbi:amidase domain-containing protein [Cryobacterium sp. PH29-G1]|uniref:amidase domain-containing protein n=1 Tax=Cryobacterium sp. PH29-G1 TaxID=3046211 RepID=UPI0024BAD7FD|nr:amidase domain-containing protein [Cryobacterium sp. PH29-G1]MDJ0348841.1 amidase domain-containing protein [Cryobacterium sp. PH29-G1]
MTRWQRIGLTSAVGAVLAVGATALVVQAVEGASTPVNSARPTDAATPAATDDPARATPTDPAAAVAVEPPAEPTAEPEPALDDSVTVQMDYALAHWKLENYNTAEWGVLGENDCVNFASQIMIARGWTMDDVWSSPKNGNAYDASAAWRSSTAFMNYLKSTGKATALTDQQRDQVKVGDIVQFDWDNSGDRDHTGIVTKVERVGDTISISFAGHTLDSDYRSVDTAITVDHPGGTAYYWSVP